MYCYSDSYPHYDGGDGDDGGGDGGDGGGGCGDGGGDGDYTPTTTSNPIPLYSIILHSIGVVAWNDIQYIYLSIYLSIYIYNTISIH